MHSEFDVIVYTDGACETNPGPGGWAALLTSGPRRKTLSGGYRRTTNNRMELRAVIEALRAIKGDHRRVKIVSDSRYVTEAVNQRWLDKWAAKGFRKGDGLRENSDLWVELRALLARHPVTFQWIKGHAEHPENEACDQLAVAARLAKELPADPGFEDPPARHAALGLSLVQPTARALFADFIPPGMPADEVFAKARRRLGV